MARQAGQSRSIGLCQKFGALSKDSSTSVGIINTFTVMYADSLNNRTIVSEAWSIPGL